MIGCFMFVGRTGRVIGVAAECQDDRRIGQLLWARKLEN